MNKETWQGIALCTIMLGSCVSCEARADSRLDLSFTVATAHFTARNYNDFNPGVIGQFYPTGSGMFLAAGAYRNSIDRNTVLGGIGHTWTANQHIDVSLTGGLMHGYELPTGKYVCDSMYCRETKEPGVLPFILPSASFSLSPSSRKKYGAITLTPIPAFEIDGKPSIAINFAYTRRLW